MLICKNCGTQCPDQATFCTQCGTPLTATNNAQEQAPVYAAPAYEAPAAPVYEAPAAPVYETPAAPTYAYAPAATPVETGSKAPAIIGMVFGIIALLLTFIHTVNVIDVLDSYYSWYSSYYISEYLTGLLVGFSIFTIPSLIVGLVMSFKANAGKGLALAGKITSFISVGLYSLSFILTISA